MRDFQLLFDNDAAITSSRVSTNIIPLGPLGDNTHRNIGEAGNQLYLVLTVGTAFTSTGSSTLAWVMQTDDATGFGSATALSGFGETIAKASLTANAKFVYPLPPGAVYEDYLRLSYTVATADFDTGTLSAEISMNPQASVRTYDSGLTVA